MYFTVYTFSTFDERSAHKFGLIYENRKNYNFKKQILDRIWAVSHFRYKKKTNETREKAAYHRPLECCANKLSYVTI